MKRRDFLGVGLAGAVGAATGTAEAEDKLDAEALDRKIQRIRAGLDEAGRIELGLGLPGTASGDERVEIDQDLIRSSLRSLFLAGSVADLPQGNQQDPQVLALVSEHEAELDHAVEGMQIRLETLPDTDRQAVEEALRSDPALIDEVAGQIVGMAGHAGASARRKKHLKELVEHALWRMRHQPLSTVIAEVTDKSREQARMMAELQPEARRSRARSTPWDRRTERLARRYAPPAAAHTPPPPGEPTEQHRLTAAQLRRAAGNRALVGLGLGVGGGLLLGLSVGTENIPLLIVSLVMFTASVVMLIVALITLIVAAVRAQREQAGG